MPRESKQTKPLATQVPYKLDWSLALQLLDTTWRVAIPILLLTYIGHRIDKAADTNPLFILIGLFLSLAIATLLVYRQIQAAYPDFFKKVMKP